GSSSASSSPRRTRPAQWTTVRGNGFGARLFLMKPFGKLRGPIEDDKPHLQAAAGGARSSATAAPWRTAAMRPASRETFVLAAPRAHPLGRRAGPAEIRELGGADVLLLDDGHCLRDQALAVCAQARTHELDFRATSLSTLTQMVGAGAGVTLLPRLAVARREPPRRAGHSPTGRRPRIPYARALLAAHLAARPGVAPDRRHRPADSHGRGRRGSPFPLRCARAGPPCGLSLKSPPSWMRRCTETRRGR